MSEKKVQLDLNIREFQDSLFKLDKDERNRVLDTLEKINQLDWAQVHKAKGLHWEKIVSVKPPKGIDAIYSLRITKARRATAYRQNDFMVFLSIEPDHDATYGKK
jgi:hypothetical protein